MMTQREPGTVSILFLACVCLGCGSSAPPPKQVQQAAAAGPQAPKPEQLDPDKALVEQWLRENLDDGHWEEVRWWPGVTLKDLHAKRVQELDAALKKSQQKLETIEGNIARLEAAGVTIPKQLPLRGDPRAKAQSELRQAYADLPNAQSRLKTTRELRGLLTDRGVRRICGMRFRTKNKLGANELKNVLFDVTNGKVSVVDPLTQTAWVDGLENGWAFLKSSEAEPQK